MKNQLKTLLLLGGLSAILIGSALGPGYLYGFTALALLLNLAAHFFSDRIVLAMHHAHEVPRAQAPELTASRIFQAPCDRSRETSRRSARESRARRRALA